MMFKVLVCTAPIYFVFPRTFLTGRGGKGGWAGGGRIGDDEYGHGYDCSDIDGGGGGDDDNDDDY